jgi:hypothetical protein
LGERKKTYDVETHGAKQTHGRPLRPTAGFGFFFDFYDDKIPKMVNISF